MGKPVSASKVKKTKGGKLKYAGYTFKGYGKKGVQNSKRKDKKKVVLVKKGSQVKLVHFGQKGYSDYTKHKNKKRRANYRARSGGIKNKQGKKTKNDPFSANYWARRILW